MKKFSIKTPTIKFYKVISIILAIILIASATTIIIMEKSPKIYEMKATVSDVFPNDDGSFGIYFTTIKDGNGWYIETFEIFEVGENYTIKFDAKNTYEIEDDEIIELVKDF